MERIRPLPGGNIGGDAPGTAADEAAVIRVRRNLHAGPLLHLRDQIFNQKPGVPVSQTVVLEAAVVARHLIGRQARGNARIDKDSHRHRHGTLRNQVVHHDGGPAPTRFRNIARAILIDHHAGGLGAVILRRNVDRNRPRCPRQHRTRVVGELDHLTFGNAGLHLGIRPRNIGRILGYTLTESGACREK